MLMEKLYLIVLMVVLGLCFGSFVNAAVWRIKHKKDLVRARSQCVHCKHTLAWYDLIPVVSWVILRAKCRNCKKPISIQYPIVELAVAALFVVSYLFWPFALNGLNKWVLFGLWLISGVILAILFIYDLKWLVLSNKLTYPLIVIGLIAASLRLVTAQDFSTVAFNIGFSVLVLAGVYLLIFIWSRGKWIGFGDVKLCLALGLLLANWQLALICLFLANLLGCAVVLPGMAMNKLTRTSHIPFGPFLIIGFIIAGLWGQQLIDWYISLTLIGVTTSQVI